MNYRFEKSSASLCDRAAAMRRVLQLIQPRGTAGNRNGRTAYIHAYMLWSTEYTDLTSYAHADRGSLFAHQVHRIPDR